MKARFTGLFIASLLCTTAAVPAVAQQAGAPQAGQTPDAENAEACQQLDRIVVENNERFQQEWLDEARTVAERDEAQSCAPYVQQAENALAQGEDAETVEGRIVVNQPPPSVNVEQPAPQVNVTQADPRVSVTQPQPEIIVRQVQPTIRIEMPQPVVTVDQPQPEIIVRMPDPQVDVQTSEPRIEVNQADPRVSVEQQEPQIDVAVNDTPDEGGEQQADIQVQQGTPQVRLQQQEGEPQVNLEQTQPRVTYEAAEPKIEFSGGEEPQVRFTESGEPNVTFADENGEAQQQQAAAQAGQQEQNGDRPPQQANRQAAAQQQAGQEQAQAANADWRGGRQPLTPPATVEVPGYQPADPSMVSADTLMGADVYSENDNSIGSVEDVVLSPQGEVEYFVLDVGGFLGIGAHTVALGMDEVTVLQNEQGNELRVHVDATREQLEQAPEYRG